MQTKKWYQSKTIWGILITAIAFFAQTYLQADITVPANPDFSQLQDIATQVKAAHGNIGLLINIALGAIGTILAIIGRVKAESKVSLPKIGSKAAMLIGFVLIAGVAGAQIKSSPFKPLPFPEKVSVSPFHRLPIPNTTRISALGDVAPATYVAYRFTAATASFDFINNKVLTGIGYGYNKMRIKTDSSGNKYWYTDLTVNINVYAAGNTAPTYHDGNTNIIAIGPSVGVLNKLINIGCLFYPGMNGSPARWGANAGIDIPLN